LKRLGAAIGAFSSPIKREDEVRAKRRRRDGVAGKMRGSVAVRSRPGVRRVLMRRGVSGASKIGEGRGGRAKLGEPEIDMVSEPDGEREASRRRLRRRRDGVCGASASAASRTVMFSVA
jgi:hypothetical protein